VLRVGRISEELGTGAQAFFDDDVKQIGFAGRDPLSIGQRNVHASYITGKGGEGLNTRIRTYVLDESFSYFAPQLFGSEHNFKVGGGVSFNEMPPRTTFSSGTFQFRGDAPYNPADPSTLPVPVQCDGRSRPVTGATKSSPGIAVPTVSPKTNGVSRGISR
jgi:hypothetical protein